MTTTVYCIATSERQADRIVRQLQAEGFGDDSLSVLFADAGRSAPARDRGTRLPEGLATGVGTGGILGGTFGWLAGMGTLLVPGLGVFVAAGPILAAVGGAAVGAAAGGIAGALVGLGMPERQARRYEMRIRAGDEILISVEVDDEEERQRVRALFEGAGAEEIADTSDGHAAATHA